MNTRIGVQGTESHISNLLSRYLRSAYILRTLASISTESLGPSAFDLRQTRVLMPIPIRLVLPPSQWRSGLAAKHFVCTTRGSTPPNQASHWRGHTLGADLPLPLTYKGPQGTSLSRFETSCTSNTFFLVDAIGWFPFSSSSLSLLVPGHIYSLSFPSPHFPFPLSSLSLRFL